MKCNTWAGVVLNRLPRRTARAMRVALNRSLARFPAAVRRTITYDNGSENVEHLRVNDVLGTDSYRGGLPVRCCT